MKVKIIIPTPLSEEDIKLSYPQAECQKILNDIANNDPNIDLEYVYENTEGLSKIYNKFLSKYKNSDTIVLLLHDDVEIHDRFFYKKLIKAHEYYDIVGLAGATKQTYNKNSPALWHHCSDDATKNLRGIVAHFFPPNTYNSVFFGKTPSEVNVIDGLFMSFNMKTIKEKIFDEDFDFHHYDLAMCQKAVEKGYSIGVWLIFVVHHGLGEFNNDEWKNSNELFLKKYGI